MTNITKGEESDGSSSFKSFFYIGDRTLCRMFLWGRSKLSGWFWGVFLPVVYSWNYGVEP